MKKILLALSVLATVSTAQAQFTASASDDTLCLGESTTLTAGFPVVPGVTTTTVSLSDDQFSGIVNIGFPFTYYGTTYTQCLISSNNYIRFNTTGAGGYSPWSITAPVPSTTPVEILNSVLGPWQDINPGIGGTIRYATVGTAPNRIFIVDYDNIPMFSCTSLCFTSQIQLHETSNIVETHITLKPLCTTWNAGQAVHATHDASGTLATVVPGRNAGMTWTASFEGTQFIPTSATSYSINPIPFNRINVGTSGTINWYVGGSLVGSGSPLTVSPTATTSYVATYTDPCGGSSLSDTVQVVVGAPFNFAGSSAVNSSCSGPTGEALLTVNDGSGSYTYAWDDPAAQTTQTADSLAPGTYTVVVSDLILNCSLDTTFVIDDNNNLTLAVTGVSPVACFSDSNGVATANVTGGVGAVTIAWDNGETGPNAVSLSGGPHSVLVSDTDGCTISATFNTPSPSALNVTLVATTDAICFGGTTGGVNISAGGGTGPYTYDWDNPANSTTQDIVGVPAGTYTVIVEDASGCTGTLSATVNQPAQVTGTSVVNNVNCFGGNDGSVTITPSGGTGPYDFTWVGLSYTTPSVSGLTAGTYTVLIQDVNNCPGTVTIVITEPVAMEVTVTGADAECGLNNGVGTTTVTGGTGPYYYMWSNGETTANASSLPVGTATVTVTDMNGCTDNASVVIGEYFNLVAAASADPVFGVLPLDVNFTGHTPGAYGYAWDFGDGGGFTTVSSGNTASYTYTEQGTYEITVVVFNAGMCSDTVTLTVEVVNESLLEMPNIITPNGDNTNDEFIPVLARFITSYQCTVFNRWGLEVFNTSNLSDGWKPASGDASGTYFYVVVASGIDGKTHTLNGSVTVTR